MMALSVRLCRPIGNVSSGTIARLIGRPEDVEDVAQEVFLRLYYSLEQLRTAEVF